MSAQSIDLSPVSNFRETVASNGIQGKELQRQYEATFGRSYHPQRAKDAEWHYTATVEGETIELIVYKNGDVKLV